MYSVTVIFIRYWQFVITVSFKLLRGVQNNLPKFLFLPWTLLAPSFLSSLHHFYLTNFLHCQLFCDTLYILIPMRHTFHIPIFSFIFFFFFPLQSPSLSLNSNCSFNPHIELLLVSPIPEPTPTLPQLPNLLSPCFALSPLVTATSTTYTKREYLFLTSVKIQSCDPSDSKLESINKNTTKSKTPGKVKGNIERENISQDAY